MSYLADQPVFYDDLSVWEHLEYVARLHEAEGWEQQVGSYAEDGYRSVADVVDPASLQRVRDFKKAKKAKAAAQGV